MPDDFTRAMFHLSLTFTNHFSSLHCVLRFFVQFDWMSKNDFEYAIPTVYVRKIGFWCVNKNTMNAIVWVQMEESIRKHCHDMIVWLRFHHDLELRLEFERRIQVNSWNCTMQESRACMAMHTLAKIKGFFFSLSIKCTNTFTSHAHNVFRMKIAIMSEYRLGFHSLWLNLIIMWAITVH